MKKRIFTSLVFVFCFWCYCSGATITVPGDHATIGGAIGAAENGDTIIVSPGTYFENINMGGKAITLCSTAPLDGDVVHSTVIDAGGSGTVITCNSSETSATVINGFMITNGQANYGGGMYNNSSSPTVRNCIFHDNAANVIGGGLISDGHSSPAIINCTFSSNTAQGGGGLCDYSSTSTIRGCTFIGNTTTGSWGGGGIFSHDSSPNISDCWFTNNTATTYGGGIKNGNSTPVITGCTFGWNSADISGSGMYSSSGLPVVSDSYFCINASDQIAGGWTDNGGNVVSDTNCPAPRQIEREVFGDSDGDGDVDLVDFAAFAVNWLAGT